jgi:long-chain acyl-CoA synthetase
MAAITRTFDLLPHQLNNFNKADTLAYKYDGEWRKYSIQEYIDYADAISYGLMQLGLGKGDKVAIVSPNRPEWNFVDMGIAQIGATSVPMYPTITEADYNFILNDSGCKAIFLADEVLLAKVNSVKGNVASLQHIYSFNKIAGQPNWLDLVELGKANADKAKLDAAKAAVTPEDLLTIIYTSGTTGTPKGVMLTHHNITSNVKASEDIIKVDASFRVLSFLPMCHIFERMVCYLYQTMGSSIYYAESLDTIAANLKEVKPDAFTTVPRLLEKVYDRIVATGHGLTGIKHKLFFWALELGERYELHGKNGGIYALQLRLANKLIFSKWREALGGNVKFIVTGSAAIQPRLARVFTAAGLTVLEGYGLTETSPVISVNRLEEDGRAFGTVGLVIDGVDVKILDDQLNEVPEGEICCKGPNVMKGYYNRPDLTAEVIDKNGYFHTGDIGRFEDGKYLKITDRKKEMFKTSGGKYVAPQVLENKFKESPFIEQVMVVGESQKFPGAIVVPAFAFLKDYCDKNGIPFTTNAEAIKDERVRKIYEAEIAKYNVSFGNWEQVKKIELAPAEWTIDTGEMTPTMKLKRKVIAEKYKDLISKIYAN